jgi:choline dehydrogenase-like flavoprotein
MSEFEADFVIVGTGAGGATAARVLSEAGFSLLLIEEGPALRTAERPRAILGALAQSARDMGTFTTRGKHPMPILQGRLVGGSTAINSGIIWRMPADVRALWRDQFGLGELVDDRGLDDTFERIERELFIADTPDEIRGNNARLMALACAELGLPGKPIQRNMRECVGSARCLQGCPKEARQSMDVSYIPEAVRRGAKLLPLAQVTDLDVLGGVATGVSGKLLDAQTRRAQGRFRAVARRGVIVATGVIHTPLLLRRAGLRGLVGERFQAHPGAAVVARFDERVTQGFGATQAYEVPMRDRGFKIETLNMPPELLAARIPGVGGEWQRRIAQLDHYAHWVAQVRMQAMGSIRSGWLGPRLTYEPTAADMAKVRDSIALLARMFFAAGAKEVSHGIVGLPPFFTNPQQVALIDGLTLDTGRVHLLASHIFGTACAGSDPRRSVVGPSLRSHAIQQLYVMDASVFPTNLGVNPQHSIMAICFRAAERLANASRTFSS